MEETERFFSKERTLPLNLQNKQISLVGLSIYGRKDDLEAERRPPSILGSVGACGKGECQKMQYLMLIYHEEKQWAELPEAEKQKVYEDFRALREDLEPKDKFKGGNALQTTATAATVRVRNGQHSITDGPFAETKEQLGGYILVDAKDREEALAIAARIPIAKTGSIEVRAVLPPVEAQR